AAVRWGLPNTGALPSPPGARGKDRTIPLPAQGGDGEPTYFLLRPFGQEMAIALIGGRRAREMERAGERAAVDAALRALKSAMGGAIERRLIASTATAWASDPLALGAYAMAKPGAAAARRRLSQPLDDRLFFAGEATHPTMPATLHGAYLSGVEAARRAAKSV
ncbi:MAG: FAD-dependent oxidoreductase, partial [Elsteraceae bacterium]